MSLAPGEAEGDEDGTKALQNARSCTLWLHTDSSNDVLFNAIHLPEAEEGDIVELSKQGSGSHASLLFHVPPVERDAPKKSQLQVSVSNGVAQAFDLQNREHVILTKLPSPLPPHYRATHCEIYFKDAYVGRSDLHRLMTQLINTCGWVGQRLTLPACSLKARLADLRVGDKKRRSALITEDTQIVFRSHSAKYYIFLQVTSECWAFDTDGSLFFEKVIGLFLPELFARWAARGTNHIISLILFSRILYEDEELEHVVDRDQLGTDALGRKYRDVYKVVSDFEPHRLFLSVLARLKEEFLDYHEKVLFQLKARDDNILAGHLSAAHEGNVLEAINLAITSFEKHYIDRDLQRTGLSCIIITCGTCHFDVTRDMLRLTRERMRSYGICLDCVSLSKVPLHQVPVFRFESGKAGAPDVSTSPTRMTEQDSIQVESIDPGGGTRRGSQAQNSDLAVPTQSITHIPSDPLDIVNEHEPKTIYSYVPPDWMGASFYSRQPDRPFRVDRFMPRCTMTQIQQLGLVEHDNATISIPLLSQDAKALTITASADMDERRRRQREREYLDIIACGGRPSVAVGPSTAMQPKPKEDTIASSISPDEDDELYSRIPDIVYRASPTPSRGSSRAAKPVPLESRGRPSSRLPTSREESLHRGRTSARPSPSRGSSPSRPLTPTINRSASIASTTRSASVAHEAVYRKPFTPALISRFAAQAKAGPLAPTSQSDATPKATSTWTSFFLGKGQRSASSSTVVPRVPSDVPDRKIIGKVRSTERQNDNTGSPSLSAVDTPRITTNEAAAAPVQPIIIRSKGGEPVPSAFKQILSESYDSEAAGATPPDVVFPSHMSHTRAESSDGVSSLEIDGSYRAHLNPSHPRVRNPHHQATENAFESRRDDHSVHWKALCTPVVLPLTSHMFPSSRDINRNYSEAKYSLPIVMEAPSVLLRSSASIEEAGGRLLRELVYQRLQQNFQIVVPAAQRGPRISANLVTATNYRDVLLNNPSGQGKTIFLTLSSHIHGLRYIAERQQIEVTVFMRKRPWMKTTMPYRFHLWTRFATGFETVDVDFEYPNPDVFDWTRLDRVVCGLETRLKSSLCFWRARFALIPAVIHNKETIIQSQSDVLDDSSNEEEIRIAGMLKMFALLDSARWQPASIGTLKNPVLSYAFTTSLPSVYVREEARETAESQTRADARRQSERLSSKTTLEDLALAMKAPGSGLSFHDRRWNLRKYHDTFIGHELVDWLMDSYADIKTRDEAIQLGLYLQEQGLFKHVNTGGVTADEERKLLDAYAFYVLSPGFARERPARNWFSRPLETRLPSRSGSPDPQNSETEKPPEPDHVERHRVLLTRSTVVDLDPSGRSDRAETAWLHYDVAYNPAIAYHLQFEWLSTSRVIEEQLGAISRLADRYGLKLVETFIGQVADAPLVDPLHRPLRIEFARALPDGPHQDILVLSLATALGYVLDQDADSRFPTEVDIRYTFRKTPTVGMQFIHLTGAVAIQVLPDLSGFLFLQNRLYVGHQEVGSKGAVAGRTETLLSELRSTCQDAARLTEIWDAALDDLPPLLAGLGTVSPSESIETPVLEGDPALVGPLGTQE